MKKHAALLLAVVLAGSMFLASCSGDGSGASAPESSGGAESQSASAEESSGAETPELSGELVVMTLAGEPFVPAWQDQAAVFTEQTGVQVTIDSVPWENLRETCTLELASATGAYDVIYVHPSWFQEFAKNGYLVPADEYTTEEDLEKYITNLVDDYRYEGTPAANSKNRNTLLFRDPSVDGLKTGHTNAAGYCLVATAQRDMPQVGGRRLLSIVLGTTSENARANESQKLLNWGYTAYDAVKLFEAGQAMEDALLWKGSQSSVKLGREAATVVTVPSGSSGQLSTRIERQDPLIAPIAKGQQIGTLHVQLGTETLAQLPVFALEEVPEGGFFRRVWDAIRLWIR